MRISTTPTLAPTPARRPLPEAPAPQQPAEEQPPVGPTQVDRLSHFVQSTKLSTAESVSSVSAAAMGYMVGSCVGAVISTPLALSFGNMYVMTGGTALAGGLGAMAGHWLNGKKKPAASEDGALRHAGMALGTAGNLLKKIAYPTVLGATAAERATVYRALDTLPMSGVNSAATIDLVHGLEKQGIAGVAHPIFSQNRILLDKEQMALGFSWGEDVTTHELGHTHDFTKGFGPIGSRSFWGGGFGKAPFISDYANTNRMEDYAESYLNYHRHPAELQAAAPAKFAALDAAHQQGVSDGLKNRPAVREAGKKIGEVLGAVPYLRTGVELGLSLIAPLHLHHGAGQLETGLANDDERLKLDGKMNVAKGALMMLPGCAPLSLAVSAAHVALQKQVDSGALTVEDASKVASTVLAASTGPVGMVAAATGGELRKAGLDLDNTTVRSPLVKGSPLAGILSTVGGAAAGGVVGSLIGTATGGAIGGVAGMLWGQVGGAALGFTGYQAASLMRTARRNGDPLALQGQDKVWLGKAVAPAVVGGIAGTVGGGYVGRLVGQAIGTALGGPMGAVTGGVLGQTAGIMGGSYAGAKAGAVAGRHWAGDLT